MSFRTQLSCRTSLWVFGFSVLFFCFKWVRVTDRKSFFGDEYSTQSTFETGFHVVHTIAEDDLEFLSFLPPPLKRLGATTTEPGAS